jgi:hypothetical protein
MARMFPDVRPETIQNKGERLVYTALQSLPDDYQILHSLPWLRPDRSLRGAPLREGEADFVLLHKQRGLMIIEVKGRAPFLEDGQWFYDDRPRRIEMKDPFTQAERNMHAIIKEIEEKSGGRLTQRSLVYGYMVFFPESRRQGDLPPNVKPSILLDASALNGPKEFIERAIAAWTSQARPLSDEDFKTVYRAILPKLRLVAVRAPQIRLDEEILVQLTEVQHQVLGGLFVNRRVLVEGGAGSGKTLLAYEAAVGSAAQGRRTLLTCYNRHLADWLRARSKADSRLGANTSRLEIVHFHGLAKQFCQRAGVPFDADAEPDFWTKKAAERLMQAATVLKGSGVEPFEALFVDEGQDFVEDWWLALEELLDDPSDGRIFVFMDLHQCLRPDGGTPPIDLPVRYLLTMNCRNTRWIAVTSAEIVGSRVDLPALAPAGEAPGIVEAARPDLQASLVSERVAWLLEQGLHPRQIAIIGPASLSKGSLRASTKIAGAPVTDDASKWREGRHLLVTTARAFKGLEADAVLVYDLDRLGDLFTDVDLYVACTRAKHLLTLIIHGKPVHDRLIQAVAGARRLV